MHTLVDNIFALSYFYLLYTLLLVVVYLLFLASMYIIACDLYILMLIIMVACLTSMSVLQTTDNHYFLCQVE